MTVQVSPVWQWDIIPAIARIAFAEKPDIPLPIWASQKVFLDRRMTTRPGFYDPDEYPWTWEFQEIIRTRHVWEKKLADGATVLVDPGTEGAAPMRVHDVAVMKSTQTGFTESALNGIRFCAKHDPQNIIFSIDNRVQAGEVNEIRLGPTLRRLGEEIFTADDDDAGKFLIKLRRMLIYFLGSYSAGAFAQKMCELGIGDELETHGVKTSAEDLRQRMKSSPRRLCALMSRPQKINGPIDKETKKGSCHVAEVPCPRCTEANDGIPAGYQQLEQDSMKFGHCKNLLGEWDKALVLQETFFECVHCKGRINESEKRWMNDRTRRRWRRTNFAAEPNFISFQISDFYSYDESVTWGRLALKYIGSKGDPVARQSYRNDHEGLPYEVRESKTEVTDILLLRGPYKRGTVPWKPETILLASDIGLLYAKWGVYAFRRSPEFGDGECAVLDWGTELHPDDVARRVLNARYPCPETDAKYRIALGLMDAKYRRIEVHRACLRIARRMFPTAGIRADMSTRSISFNRVPNRPRWFGVIVYRDMDAKHELYTERIGSWVAWLRNNSPPEERPFSPRIWFPEDVHATDDGKAFVLEHTKESLIELPGLTHTAKQFDWKRKGANEGGDISKLACMGWRFFTLGDTETEAEAVPEPAASEE
jgi:hypothetical protein